MVELIEAIAGIKQSRANSSLTLIAREVSILSRPRVNLRGQQSLSTNALHGCAVLQVTIMLFNADTILRTPGRLWPDGLDSMEVGFDARSKTCAELEIAALAGDVHHRLGIGAVGPQMHPYLPNPDWLHTRFFSSATVHTVFTSGYAA
jgi:hypothetical protein